MIARVLRWLERERGRQEGIWGQQTLSPTEWVTVLTEEVGEVAQQVNHGDFRTNGKLNPWEYQDQLLHVAAVAVAALEDLGLETDPTCLGMTAETIGNSAADVSPYPPHHFHRKLASFSVRDLQSELALRWAFAVHHARQQQTGPGPDRCAEELLRSLLADIRDLGASLPESARFVAGELDPLADTLKNALPDAL